MHIAQESEIKLRATAEAALNRSVQLQKDKEKSDSRSDFLLTLLIQSGKEHEVTRNQKKYKELGGRWPLTYLESMNLILSYK